MKIDRKFAADRGREHPQHDPAIVKRFYPPDQRAELRQMAHELVEQLSAHFRSLRAEHPEAAALILKYLKEKNPADAVH